MALDAAGRIVMIGTINNLFGIIRVIGKDYAIQFYVDRTYVQWSCAAERGGGAIECPQFAAGACAFRRGFHSAEHDKHRCCWNWQYEDTTSGTGANRFYRVKYP